MMNKYFFRILDYPVWNGLAAAYLFVFYGIGIVAGLLFKYAILPIVTVARYSWFAVVEGFEKWAY